MNTLQVVLRDSRDLFQIQIRLRDKWVLSLGNFVEVWSEKVWIEN